MADDIVARLREQAQAPALAWLSEAADEIVRLRAEMDEIGNPKWTKSGMAEEVLEDILEDYPKGGLTWNMATEIKYLRELCDLLATMLDHQANDHLYPHWVDAKNEALSKYRDSRTNQ